MPYAVKCYPGKDAGVILCKDEIELGSVNADIVRGLKFNVEEAKHFCTESTNWILSQTPEFQQFPVTIYKITEEEYEKWQQAF